MSFDWLDIAIVPLLGAVVGFGVWYFQSRIEQLRREQEKLHDERREVYSSVLDPFIRIFAGVENPEEVQKATEFMKSLEYKRVAFQFTLVADDNVVRSFNNLVDYILKFQDRENENPDPYRILGLWGTFMLEIRKNIGNAATELTPKDMLRSQIKDVENIK